MIREMDRCPYCASPIQIGEASWVICEYCGREMEVTRFTQEEKRLVEVVEDARRSSEAAAEDVRRKVEALSRAHSRETENAVNIARGALETCQSALESLSGQLERSEARKLRNLYAQAEEAQRAGRFEEAERWYRQVLITAGDEAEVYWRLVMCSYGIEYVREQATGKYLPTISHMVVDSVLDNADYRAAVRMARSAEMRSYYEAEARHIDGILDKYRQVAATEQPYDVFISVKQGDEQGNPTHDSLVAQDLYYMLVNEFGLKVFNSRISLSQYAGFEFEPYIMDALMRAKVMIVVGTRQEYMTSAWVRNEWRRFRWLKDNDDDSRRLIAWVSGMAVREIPREMGDLQAINAGAMGAMDTLRSIIRAAFSERLRRKTDSDPLLERAAMYLEDGEFDQVDRCCERVLDRDPRNAKAYVLKLCARCKARREEQLADACEALDPLGDYKRAMRFGDEKLKQRLEEYNRVICKRIEEAAKNRAVMEALEAELCACESVELSNDEDVQALEKRVRQLSGKMQEIVGAEPLLERCRRQMNRCRDAYAQIQEAARKKRRREQQTRDMLKSLCQSLQIVRAQDALDAIDRLQAFVRSENDFAGMSDGDGLLQACGEAESRFRSQYEELKAAEVEAALRIQRQEKLRRDAEEQVRAFELVAVRESKDAEVMIARIQEYVRQQDHFRKMDGGMLLLNRCNARMEQLRQLHGELLATEERQNTLEQNRERQKQIERTIKAFENEQLFNGREARNLYDRIGRFVDEEAQFRDMEKRSELLDRCDRRQQACLRWIASLGERAEAEIAAFEREEVTKPAEALGLSNRIQRFIDEQDEFKSYDNGRELMKRCRKRIDECAALHHRLTDLAEQDEKDRRARKERTKAAEKRIAAFEKEKIHVSDDALELNSRIRQYIAEQGRFAEFENGSLLLKRCENRLYECAQIYQELKNQEESIARKRLNNEVDEFVAAIRSRVVRSGEDLRKVSEEVTQFLEAHHHFSGVENGEDLVQRCRKVSDEKWQEIAGKTETSDWQSVAWEIEQSVAAMEKRKIRTVEDALKLRDDVDAFRRSHDHIRNREEWKPYRERLDAIDNKAVQQCNRLTEEANHTDKSAPMPRAKKCFIALLAAVLSMFIHMTVGGSVLESLAKVFVPVFGGVIAVLTAVQAHNRKKTGLAAISWLALVMWILYGVYMNGMF